ncbi:A/G-specific adenine glycosylase [Frankia sp. AiPa1]|uniref:A/G-specific adenine glycosylase n=1 Tax=Frankia sp. AiPa1 TaxID=573492 RepID=UPI0035A9985A
MTSVTHEVEAEPAAHHALMNPVARTDPAAPSTPVERAVDSAGLGGLVLDWFAGAARDLPWRHPGTTPWAVLVSEVMLQQTPVSRVLPVWGTWLARWPTPAALAAEASGEAVRAWGRLGYPRRALRLHQAASAVVERHAGEIPADVDALLALPGIGTYTARAVAAFAFRQRHPVVDVNVRRLYARAVEGRADPPTTVSRADLAGVAKLLPADPESAARTSAALMELGALVCVARAPRCPACPLQEQCAWLRAGSPAGTGPARRPQGYAGTDRQVRGRLLAVLRDADHPVDRHLLDQVWEEPIQRDRALAGLLDDGLVVRIAPGVYALPS